MLPFRYEPTMGIAADVLEWKVTAFQVGVHPSWMSAANFAPKHASLLVNTVPVAVNEDRDQVG